MSSSILTYKVLLERVAEDDETTDRHDHQPVGPCPLHPLGRGKIADGCSAHQRRNGRYPNRVQVVRVEAHPIDEKPQSTKRGRPQRGEGATENRRTADPLSGHRRSDQRQHQRAPCPEHDPAVPVNGRAFGRRGSIQPEFHPVHSRKIGEKRPIEPFIDRVEQRGSNAERDREGANLASRLRFRGRRFDCAGAVELGESPRYVQGLRHSAPTPRKSLATWPTIKAYHTPKARKTVTALRMPASAASGCRQKYQ